MESPGKTGHNLNAKFTLHLPLPRPPAPTTQQQFDREQTLATQKESKQTTQKESAKAKATVLIGIVVSLSEDNMLLNQQIRESRRVFFLGK